MGFKLCMAEKPSVAKDIASVIGATRRCDGYFEGNGYRVTWAVGHLVGLAEPEDYGFVSQSEMYADKKDLAYAELPLLPQEFKLIVLEATKDQFAIVKRLINDDSTDVVINCGDMGAEGHILQWFIREKAGCKKPVLRFCATSMTEEAIRDAMAHLRKEEEFANIIKGEYCKKKADWIMGMSLSRAESLKYRTNITVGRVQSPTLYFVVQRYLEVMKFKVTDYYGMTAKLLDGFNVFWTKDNKGDFAPADKDSEGRVLNKNAVEKKRQEIEAGRTGIVSDLQTAKKGNDRPQLFDITELEREANKRYGYSPALTLATAQCLYETFKVLSYPRTDSRYITSDLKPYMLERVKMIGTIKGSNQKYEESVERLVSDGLNIDKKIVDDSKVTDHHALIVTEKIKGFDFATLVPPQKEKKSGVTHEVLVNILNLVCSRMVVAFSKPYYYEQTDVAVTFGNGMVFTARGKRPLQLGWKEVQDRLEGKLEEDVDEEKEEEQLFPALKKGQTVTVSRCVIVPKKTTPPKLHTEATLLTAMENAGATIENGAILKGRGIGTQATRAEIIKKLFDNNYCTMEKKGKTNYIVPTSVGLTIIKVLPKELSSPKITADWETKIALIAGGKMTEKEFMDEFTEFIRNKVDEVKNASLDIEFKKEREVHGLCPWCKNPIYRWENKEQKTVSFYCSSKECKCRVDSDNVTVRTWTGKGLTESQMKHMLIKGRIALDAISKKDGSKYKCLFELTKVEKAGNVYCNVVATKSKK